MKEFLHFILAKNSIFIQKRQEENESSIAQLVIFSFSPNKKDRGTAYATDLSIECGLGGTRTPGLICVIDAL
jgi:hypothetical protein